MFAARHIEQEDKKEVRDPTVGPINSLDRFNYFVGDEDKIKCLLGVLDDFIAKASATEVTKEEKSPKAAKETSSKSNSRPGLFARAGLATLAARKASDPESKSRSLPDIPSLQRMKSVRSELSEAFAAMSKEISESRLAKGDPKLQKRKTFREYLGDIVKLLDEKRTSFDDIDCRLRSVALEAIDNCEELVVRRIELQAQSGEKKSAP